MPAQVPLRPITAASTSRAALSSRSSAARPPRRPDRLRRSAGRPAGAPRHGWRSRQRSWVSRPGVDGFAALFGARVYLNTTGRTAPFVTAEAGLFHASVTPSDSRAPDFYLDRTVPDPRKRHSTISWRRWRRTGRARRRTDLASPRCAAARRRGWMAGECLDAGRVHFTYRFSGAPGSP